MTYVSALHGGGGWPLSVFLSPDLKPLMGGTYFPPDDNYGRPGFKTVLRYQLKHIVSEAILIIPTKRLLHILSLGRSRKPGKLNVKRLSGREILLSNN
jgi:hypothetical protein